MVDSAPKPTPTRINPSQCGCQSDRQVSPMHEIGTDSMPPSECAHELERTASPGRRDETVLSTELTRPDRSSNWQAAGNDSEADEDHSLLACVVQIPWHSSQYLSSLCLDRFSLNVRTFNLVLNQGKRFVLMLKQIGEGTPTHLVMGQLHSRERR
jgi:hypothetical protein